MSHMWLGYYNVSDEEYKARVAAKQTRTTQQE